MKSEFTVDQIALIRQAILRARNNVYATIRCQRCREAAVAIIANLEHRITSGQP